MANISKNLLLQKFLHTRNYSISLTKNLNEEDMTPQSAVFASPVKWHLAHTTWFFEEMILKNNIEEYNVFNQEFAFLFNSYYNSLGERIERENRGLITRPTSKEVFEYRNFIDQNIIKLIESKNIDKEIEELIILGINHEQQHQELILTDLKYLFSKNPTYPKYTKTPLIESKNEEKGWLKIDEGIFEIGYNGSDFHFDNEKEVHKQYLEKFSISKSLVTCGEFMAFIEDGGYHNPVFWLDEGWAFIQNNNVSSPLYWKKHNNEWVNYTLAGLQKVNPEAELCHISYYEANAFANYKGYRLPTEFEWEVASKYFNWGKRWEWTASAYLPYPRFKIAKGSVGEYNGKFMINQMVLKGASVATSEGHSRNTYRNFFHPESRWQFSGIRLAKH